MQVTSLLSQHEHQHDAECGCGHDHEHSTIHLWQTVLGVVFVVNAFIVDWVFTNSHTVASASALIGALMVGFVREAGITFFPEIELAVLYLMAAAVLMIRPAGILGRA